jgi:hypothetical protein
MRAGSVLSSLAVSLIAAAAVLHAPHAQASATEEFLKTAWQDPEVLEAKSSDYDPEKAWSPFREVEIFGTDEAGSNESRLEGGFSFDIKSLREIRESYRASSMSQGAFLRDVRLGQAIKRRYDLLVDYYYAKKIMKQLEDYGEVLGRSFKAQSLALRYGKATAQNILKAQVALSKNQREMREAAGSFEAIKAQMKAIYPEFRESSFNFKNFITPEDIASQRSLFKPGTSSVSRKLLETELTRLQSEKEIALARENAWIKGLKLSVQGKGIDRPGVYDSEDYQTVFKATLSFRLPFLGDDLLAIQSRPERLEKVYEKQRELNVLNSEAKGDPSNLKALIDSYTQINKTLNSLSKVERSILDPQVALDTILSVRAARTELLSLEKEIMVAYVDLLFEQSVLTDQPDVNHLSAAKARL